MNAAQRTQRRVNRLNAVAFAKLIAALHEGEHTVDGLIEVTGLSKLTVYRYTRALHNEGAIHICGWGQDSRGKTTLRIYQLGPGKDVKPARVTPKESRRRWRAKQKQIAMCAALAGAANSTPFTEAA